MRSFCFPLFAAVIADPVIGVDRPFLLPAHAAKHTDRTKQQCAEAAFAGTVVFSLCCGLVDHAAILTAAFRTFHCFFLLNQLSELQHFCTLVLQYF